LTSLRVCTCSECRHVRVPAPRHAGAHCNSGQLADTPSSGPRAGRSSRADRRRLPAARPRQTTPPPPPLQHAARAHMRTTSFRMPNIITPSARARPRQHNTRNTQPADGGSIARAETHLRRLAAGQPSPRGVPGPHCAQRQGARPRAAPPLQRPCGAGLEPRRAVAQLHSGAAQRSAPRVFARARASDCVRQYACTHAQARLHACRVSAACAGGAAPPTTGLRTRVHARSNARTHASRRARGALAASRARLRTARPAAASRRARADISPERLTAIPRPPQFVGRKKKGTLK
jgi:hypothetical protein